MGLSLLLIILGYILLSKGWKQIHAAKGALVTDGIYAYVRHPQYTGLFLVIIGFLVQWPTLLTVIMAPILLYAYVHLARLEERKALAEFGDAYKDYISKTPRAFFPPVSQWYEFLSVRVATENKL
jgi:protein-S-isoprenylcysteine O-methyltransferase Ste14